MVGFDFLKTNTRITTRCEMNEQGTRKIPHPQRCAFPHYLIILGCILCDRREKLDRSMTHSLIDNPFSANHWGLYNFD